MQPPWTPAVIEKANAHMATNTLEQQPCEADDPAALRRADRRAAWLWGSIIVALLGIQVLAGVIAIVLATADPTVAVVPDYYGKAIRWDQTQQLRRASRELGWRVVAEVAPQSTIDPLRIHIHDAQQQPLVGIRGTLQLYHHARATAIESAELEPLAPGLYTTALRLDRPGLWQLEMDLQGPGDERFLDSQTIHLDPPTLPPSPSGKGGG